MTALVAFCARYSYANDPIVESRILSSGLYWVTVSNSGEIGSAPGLDQYGNLVFNIRYPQKDMSALNIEWVPSFEFPAGRKSNYLSRAGLMIGGIIGFDSLVSTTNMTLLPFYPEILSFDNVWETSSNAREGLFDPSAVADQQLDSDFSDTSLFYANVFLDGLDKHPHQPLGVEVRMRAMSWQSETTRDILILDYLIVNIGHNYITEPALAFVIQPIARNFDRLQAFDHSSIVGYMDAIPSVVDGEVDSLRLAWAASNDGNPIAGTFDRSSTPGAIGVLLLNSPAVSFSFNWFTLPYTEFDTWGPRMASSTFGDYGSDGWPYGDRAMYYLMTNGEIDYDQVFAARDFSDEGWAKPPGNAAHARDVADGTAVDMVLSCGLSEPFLPGDTLGFTVALLAVEHFHKDPYNFVTNFNPDDPAAYLEGLNWPALYDVARRADWLYDAPGVDTDGDGYFGEYHLTNCRGSMCDTVWWKGDGVPDWGGAQAPPSPPFEVTTRPNAVTLRWNGSISETAVDLYSRQHDFEGYRIYSSRLNAEGTYALIASWDIPNDFYRLAYDTLAGSWKQISYPRTVSRWRKELGQPDFDPADYAHPSLLHAYRDTVDGTERLSYWAPQLPNQGNTFEDGGTIEQNLIQQVAVLDTIIGDDTLQYGVYEFTIDNLNAATPLWFAVTAFDYGDYQRGKESLEGTANANSQFAFPVYSADVVVDSGLQVTVYPNPYKGEFDDAFGNRATYFSEGFEGYGKEKFSERDRRIWFANLPDTADIRIYSLDGDLIREIHHPDPFVTRYNSVVGWDLISRNTQAIVSGIYIWRVDSRLGTQVGKLVIIK